jgi:PAS domain-containing protein
MPKDFHVCSDWRLWNGGHAWELNPRPLTRAYAESLIKNAPDPVFVSDLNGKILQANDAVFNLLGFRPDELIEHSLSRFISSEETREFIAALRGVVERGATLGDGFP